MILKTGIWSIEIDAGGDASSTLMILVIIMHLNHKVVKYDQVEKFQKLLGHLGYTGEARVGHFRYYKP